VPWLLAMAGLLALAAGTVFTAMSFARGRTHS
jgi:hypothetical protein